MIAVGNMLMDYKYPLNSDQNMKNMNIYIYFLLLFIKVNHNNKNSRF